MSATMTNGRPRKQLSEQLDRLDLILDCLADGLNQAVADAAREGTRLAVKDAILEILTNPELRAAVRAAGGDITPQPVRPNLWARLKAKAAAAKALVVAAVTPVVAVVADRGRAAVDAVVASARAVATTWHLRKLLLVGLGAGAATAAVAYLAPHALAAAAAGVGGAVTAVGVQVAARVRRSVQSLGLSWVAG